MPSSPPERRKGNTDPLSVPQRPVVDLVDVPRLARVNVELRHLRAFVAVAEELNFTRAAQRLHLAQQALSKQIAQLEERVGTPLVERTTRKVALTPAGVALLEQARPLLQGAEEAVAAAREAGAVRATLNVGFVAAVTYEPAGVALDAFRRARPDVQLNVVFGDLLDPAGGLRTGESDVAFTHGPFDETGLESEFLWEEPMGILAAEGHALAEGPVLLADVIAQPTFDFPTPDVRWRGFWMLTEQRGGRPPKIVAQFHSLDAMIGAVRAGLGIHLSAECIQSMLPPGSGVVFRPIADMPGLEHFVSWRAGDRREVVADFVAAAREAFAGTPAGATRPAPGAS